MADILKIAQKYHLAGLSILPLDGSKIPPRSWKANQSHRIAPSEALKTGDLIGIVCGAVSGNLEIIDIDVKYDLTGSLYKDYVQLIQEQDNYLLPKLLIEESPTGGFHFIYRCPVIEGNQKLANRATTEEEKTRTYNEYLEEALKDGVLEEDAKKRADRARVNDKVRVLIETRGEGGYFMCAPCPGYKVVHGDFENINTITEKEREILLSSARMFDQKKLPKQEEKKVPPADPSFYESPLDEFNSRGDVLEILKQEGWTVAKENGSKILLLRPNGKGKWSADYDSEKRLFYVFTTSSEFEANKAYNPVNVLCTLKFGGDFKECAKWLKNNGYGKNYSTNSSFPQSTEEKILSKRFYSSTEDAEEYLQQVRDGTFKMGLTTGFKKLDEYWRFKPNHLVIANGHDNVGKSVVMWYFAVISAVLHKWKWIIYAGENMIGGVYRKLMEFYLGRPLRSLSSEEYDKAKQWVDEYFTIIICDDAITYSDLLKMGSTILENKKYHSFLIDPYNSLFRNKNRNDSDHEYDYNALGNMRIWIKKNNCSIYINCHSITEALRRVYPHNHDKYPGMAMPPGKADTEGGGKFSNRSDDFLTFHRMTQHQSEWMWNEIHVRKVKYQETGGRQTFIDEPFRLKMINGGCGFQDETGHNPLARPGDPQVVVPEKDELEIPRNVNFYEPQRENDDLPF